MAIPGGRITLDGDALLPADDSFPDVTVGGVAAHVVAASSRRVSFLVPEGTPGGRLAVQVGEEPGESVFIDVGRAVTTGLHQVDSPVFDRQGVLYVTYSGSRGEESPVAVFRVTPDGVRESLVTGVTNPTSMAFDPEGRLHVSSRFDGTVLRIGTDGRPETMATDLGVTCGLAFAPDGTLLAGDRSGSIWRVTPAGDASVLATLPPSVAAYHLALSSTGDLFVTAPTLNTSDHVYRITPDGRVHEFYSALGRPQGIAIGPDDALYVVDALAGLSGVYRFAHRQPPPELVLTGPDLVGLAFNPQGGWVVATRDTVFRFDSLPGLVLV
jgi:sugar lactone lactonase YvrE